MRFRQFFLALSGVAFLVPMALGQGSADYRLPNDVQPVSQSMELKLDPSQPDYSGHVTIELDVTEDRDSIGIHQVGLTLDSITLRDANALRSMTATAGDYDINWLSDGEVIPAGRYQLNITFHGKYSTDSLGMHRVTFEGNDYVFTQFEGMYGRRAMPLFDEPSFKIPYQLTIVAPEGLSVISNNPVAKRTEAAGWQQVDFEQTPPLPSYLIAYGVGPMDRSPIPGMSVPGFVYTPKGYGNQVGFVTRETHKIVAALEDYFDLKYPYAKLDLVAVPEFAFGAMENPGLITFRTDLLLVGDEVSGTTAQQVLGVIAHEVAHIWYGDLVTMAWWDDIWLNESFATWMGGTIMRTVYPEFESGVKLMRSGAFSMDQSTSSKAIRRDVKTEEEANQDGYLRYSKGQAILGMLESYVGPDVWQRSIRQYVRQFAWGNATDKDLWRVVAKESGMDVVQIADDFLKQPGYAILTFDNDGKVSQQRYLPYGAEAPDLSWRIPLTVKYKKDNQVKETFYLLDKKSGALDIPNGADWLYPDANAMGYYRWQTDADQFNNLLDDLAQLTDREKVALLDNSSALWNSRKLSFGDYMDVVDRLLDEKHPLVFSAALTDLRWIGDNLITTDTAAPFAEYLNKRLMPRFQEIGVKSKADDSEAIIELRPRLLLTLGQFGSSPVVVDAARNVAEKYLAKPDSVQSELGEEALAVTALRDDGGRYESYIRAYSSSKSERQKSAILSAIYFKDPEVIKKFLDFSISSAVPAGDVMRGIGNFAPLLDDHQILYDWLATNFDAFQAKIPQYQRSYVPQVLVGVCTSKNRQLLADFFVDKGEIYAASLAKALESLDRCIERKQREHDAFASWLKGRN